MTSDAPLFERFGVRAAQRLGAGGESEVYALDDARVLRVYWPGASAAYIERRAAWYDLLRSHRPPFELPYILEQGSLGDRRYTVEHRMRGRSFAHVLPGLEGAARERALASYLLVAEQIGAITLPDESFGELLTAGEPIRRASWAEYVRDRLEQTYALSRADLAEDVPEVEAVLEQLHAELAALADVRERRLVHGDYFPGNVYIDDDLAICGVGDFGYTTLVGDPRLDLTGALAFLEVVDGYRPSDTALLTGLIVARHGAAATRWLACYRRYYSFYFSTCKRDDPRTYAWCVGNLRASVPR